MPTHEHPRVECLGRPTFESPLLQRRDSGFVDDAARVRAEVELSPESRARPEILLEKAGQHLFEGPELRRDASGNALHEDIGPFLCNRIRDHFAGRGIPINLKYLDPSYLIRSIRANAWDCFLSQQMARQAVHAAMAGKTGVMIGLCRLVLIHVPISTAVAEGRKHVDPSGELWTAVLATTSQPDW